MTDITICGCTGCFNEATHTWQGHPTCDNCGTPGTRAIEGKVNQELNRAVDVFSDNMKFRLGQKAAKGYTGWQEADIVDLRLRLLKNSAHASVKLDAKSLVDTANLAMMLHYNIYGK